MFEHRSSHVRIGRCRWYGWILILIAAMGYMSCQKETGTADVSSTVAGLDSVASADGVTIYYEVRGGGDRTLVLVHGWSCDGSYWEKQAEEFSRDYRVVTLDLAGHGRSGSDRETWEMSSYGGDVAAVVEKLGTDEVILVGHSMGGAVIIEAARQLGTSVKALIGVDTYQDFLFRLSEDQIEAFLAPFSNDFVASAEIFVRSMFSSTADSALVDRIAADMAAAPPEVAIALLNNFLQYHYDEVLRDVRLPVRCVNSDMWPINMEGNRQVTASFDAKIMPGTGHFLHLVNPDAFNKLLRETLAEFWSELEMQ